MKPITVHDKNIEKHGITPEEVEECFIPRKLKYLKKARRGVYQIITQLSSGRFLEILYEDRSTEFYVFHAMDARPFQVDLLKRRGKRR